MGRLRSTAAVFLGGKRKKWGLLGIFLGALALSACSEVDTDLVLDGDLSGERVMSVFISSSDLESNVDVTVEEVNALTEAALPTALAYDPFAEVDEGVEATFTLSFSDQEAYISAVEELLEVGDVDTVPEIEVAVLDSPFSSGIRVGENFSSTELLQWWVNMLVDEGVISESDSSSALSGRDSYVTYDGEEIESYSSYINVDTTEENGMSRVSMQTTLEPDDEWSRTFTFVMDDSDYRSAKSAADEFFEEGMPDEATVRLAEKNDWERTWEVQLPALPPEELAEATNQVLLSEGSKFSVEEAHVPGVFGVQVEITDTAECTQICSQYAPDLADTLVLGSGWALDESTSGGVSETDEGSFTFATDQGPVLFNRYLDLASVDVEFGLGFMGGVDAQFRFAVPGEEDTKTEEAIRTLLSPTGKPGDVSVSHSNGTTTYTSEIRSSSPAALGAHLDQYAPGSSVASIEKPGLFKNTYAGVIVFELESLVGDAPLLGEVTYEVTTPFLHSFKEVKAPTGMLTVEEEVFGASNRVRDLKIEAGGLHATEVEVGLLTLMSESAPEQGTVFGEPLAQDTSAAVVFYAASGMSLAGLIIIGVLVLLIVAAILVAVLNRKKIVSALDARKQSRMAAMAAAPQAEAGMEGPQGAASSAGSAPRPASPQGPAPYPPSAHTSTPHPQGQDAYVWSEDEGFSEGELT